jgi:hypothetical protein
MLGDEADRLVREERARRQANELAEEEKRKSESISRFHALADEIEALTPIVLSLLKQKGYPERNEILVPGSNPSIFNRRPKSVVKAGWHIGSYTYIYYGDEQGGDIYLLSDGRVAFRGGGFDLANPCTLRDLRSRSKETLVICWGGLNSLRKRLESMH